MDGTLDGSGIAPNRDDALLRFRMALVDQLDQVRGSDKAVKTVLRLAQRLFGAESACVAVALPAGGVEPRYLAPRGAAFDAEPLAELGLDRRPKLPGHLMTGALERRGRTWGFLVLRREAPFQLDERRDLVAAAAFASRQLRRIDLARAADVRERIDRKVLEQLRPVDLFYQVLHGLRSLTRYDHSAAVLIFEAGTSSLRVGAEQIAWRKAKSERVGVNVSVSDDVLSVLETGAVHLLCRPLGGGWQAERGDGGGALLAARLDATRVASLDDEQQPAGALLVAPLVARDRLLAVLEIASCHQGSLGAWEAELLRRFLPQAAVAVANLHRAESLEQGMLEAERKHVMAELARGVSHDVNNALGAVLPLVQQMAADLRHGVVEPEVLADDLAQVEASVNVCRRIFGGMLAFGQGARSHHSHAQVGRAAHSALTVLEESLRRQAVTVVEDLESPLPSVRGTLGDLEQVVLNLAVNARDAMPSGGTLTIRARREASQVVLLLSDTGRGIPEGDMARVAEPFFTTKRHGNGLGLSICRSIVWTMGGTMVIESAPDEGTSVTLTLPAAEDPS
jgi:signal transduction histidine kinase